MRFVAETDGQKLACHKTLQHESMQMDIAARLC